MGFHTEIEPTQETHEGHFKTRAKSHDHEIVRPKRKCPKVVPTHLQHHVVWSRTFECSVKSYMTWA